MNQDQNDDPRQQRPPASNRGRRGKDTPPSALAIEREVIGGAMADENACDLALAMLTAESFFERRYAFVFEAIAALDGRGEPVDLSTVTQEMREQNTLRRLAKEQPAAELSEILTSVGSATNQEHHCRILLEKQMLRRLVEHGGILRSEASKRGADAFEVLDSAERELMAIGTGTQVSDGPRRVGENAPAVLESIRQTMESTDRRGVTGLDTGDDKLNQLTAGWQNDDLIVVAGRPSMGKTSFALNQALMAAAGGVGVGIWSLEMSTNRLIERLQTYLSRVALQKIRRGTLSKGELDEIERANAQMANIPLYIDSPSQLTAPQLRSRARRLKRRLEREGKRLGLVVIDYLQMMTGHKGESREKEIAAISIMLKALAKELGLPVMALSQLNRSVERRGGDKRPQLSDLRESGQIEQDADVVAFVYRAERYGMTQTPNGESLRGVGEIIIEKQRNGPVGKAHLAFVKKIAKWESLAQDHPLAPAPF